MSAKSKSSLQLSDLEEIISKLPQEYIDAMNMAILVDFKKIKVQLTEEIYHTKQKELIEILNTQINFSIPKTLKDPKYSMIKKDIIFYKNAYENEAANVNKIITATNKLNHELYQPLKDIKNALNKHFSEFKQNIKNLTIPHEGLNKGVDSINNKDIKEENKSDFEQNKKDLDKSMDSYKQKAIEFFKEYDVMNADLSESIKEFIESFIELKNNVTELKREILNGFSIFENITPDLENLDDQENIRKLTGNLLFPLNKISELISKSQQQISTFEGGNTKPITGDIANVLINICNDLKNKAKSISEKINQIRMKVNLNNIELPPIEFKDPDVNKINDNLGEMKKQLEDTKKENQNIQEELFERTKNFLNQTRLDILFIIDCTNSVNLYLQEIKTNFTNMIEKIQRSCPMATIYIGFIGYLDFLDKELDEEYIDIELTTDITQITEKIKNLKSHGGGDIAEDIAGAFEMALKKDWQGMSRFTILAADAPCHGIEFHGNADKKYDSYPQGDPENRDIKEYVRRFAENNISLFCGKFTDETDKMFDIFKEEYNKGKKQGSNCQFTAETCEDLCEIIIEKASLVYQVNRKEDVESNDNN